MSSQGAPSNAVPPGTPWQSSKAPSQLQELVQAIALLSRKPGPLASYPPMTRAELDSQRLCLGLPLLLLEPLQVAAGNSAAASAGASAAGSVAIQPEEAAEQAEGTDLDQEIG